MDANNSRDMGNTGTSDSMLVINSRDASYIWDRSSIENTSNTMEGSNIMDDSNTMETSKSTDKSNRDDPSM
jgi:hypothetical protein